MIAQAVPLLRRVAGRDQVYQVASTRFALLTDRIADGARLAHALEWQLSSNREDANLRIVSAAAIGVFSFSLGTVSAAEVLRSAFGAALDARRSGKGIAIHSRSSDRAHQRRFELLRDFEEALHTPGQLRLVAQPRGALADGRCIGAELLLRWRHPRLGEVSPGEFIPLVEHSTLARAMTDWVLDNGLAAVARLPGPMGLTGSLNVSAANLEENDLVERIQLYMLKHRLRPDQIEVEVTESAAMSGSGRPLQQLKALARAGIGVAIDDFGTGYSSLSYIRTLPADAVKIDQSFVQSLLTDARSRSVVQSMIALFKELGHRVVAEGVECAGTQGLLASMGCDELQGFHYARPMELDSLASWISGTAQQVAA